MALLIARQIGPTAFGSYSVVFAVFMIFSAAAGLGLKDVVIDEIASGRRETREVISTAAGMLFISGTALAIAFIAIYSFIYTPDKKEFWIAFILSAILMMKCGEAVLIGLEAHAKLRTAGLAQQLSIVAGAVAKTAVLLMGATAVSFAAVTTFEFAVLFTAAVLLASREDICVSLRDFRAECAMKLLSRSWPLAASSLSVLGYFYADQIIISLLLNDEAVGVYAAASRISQQLYVLPAILVAAYYPRLTEINHQVTNLFTEGFTALVTVLTTLALLVCGMVLVLGNSFLEIVLGGQFHESAEILKLHALGLILVSLNIASGRWYVMQGLERLTLARQLFTAGLNIVLNILMIPTFGLNGAVYATLISLTFLAIGFDLVGARTRPLAKIKFAAFAAALHPGQAIRAFRLLGSI